MQDPEYKLLHGKIPEFHDRQLAHAISASIPSSMQERINTKLGITALGLDILRQVKAVHYEASTVKFKIKAAADPCCEGSVISALYGTALGLGLLGLGLSLGLGLGLGLGLELGLGLGLGLGLRLGLELA